VVHGFNSAVVLTHLIKKFPAVESRSTLPSSQKPTDGHSWVQFSCSWPISPRCILILSYSSCLCLLSCLFLWGFPTKMLCVFLKSPLHVTDPICLIFYPIVLDEEYKLWNSYLHNFQFFLQPYEINLQLTGLVSRLAMLPHPYLHEYLLNPLLPLHNEANSLFSILQLVAGELVSQIPLMENYKHLLYSTRQKLLGDGSNVL